MEKIIWDSLLFLFCILLPYTLLWKKPRVAIRAFFIRDINLLIIGLISFSVIPIYYDIIFASLSYFDIFYRIIYIVVPFSLIIYTAKVISKPAIIFTIEALIFLIIWLPLEFDILPGGKMHISTGIDIPVTVLGAIPLIFYLYIITAPKKELGLGFRLNKNDIFILAYSIIILFVIIVPLGFYLDFLEHRPMIDLWYLFILKILFFIIFVAYPEEVLFRGILINIFKEYTFFKIFWILVISSLIFGSAHILNDSPGFTPPNWRYFLLASIAGWFYGWVYIKTGKLFTAVLLHAFVDSIWVHFFMI